MLDTVSSMKTTTSLPPEDINLRIARRVVALRAGSGLALDALAVRSGVSRSTISLIERGETSATAVVLEKLAAGLGVALAALFEVERALPGPLMRRAEQPQWRDPASGYLRRNVSPPDYPSPLRIVEVEFPAGKRVVLEGGGHSAVIQQQVWMLEGRMALTHAGQTWRLEAGDCLAMRVDGPVEFRNPTRSAARYAVVMLSGIATGMATEMAPPARSAAKSAKR